jgi:hypothetical protein
MVDLELPRLRAPSRELFPCLLTVGEVQQQRLAYYLRVLLIVARR